MTRLYDWFPVVTGRIGQVLSFVPTMRMSGDLFLVLNFAVVTFLLSVSPFVYLGRLWALRTARIAAAVEIINGLAHISGAVFVAGYYSGSVSGIGLVIVGILVLKSRPPQTLE